MRYTPLSVRKKYFSRKQVYIGIGVVLVVLFGLGTLFSYRWFIRSEHIPASALSLIRTLRGAPTVDIAKPQEPIDRNFGIVIPSIGVNAPIKANVDGTVEYAYLPRVLQGVAHYKAMYTGKVQVSGKFPGEGGNVFLFGHSQIPGGDMSDYSGVFNDLDTLSIGDRIDIYYQDTKYEYQIIEGRVVSRDAVEYLEDTDTEMLTLMSCWPLGLDMKRYIILAEPV